MASSYGVGRTPGVDLPADEQAAGAYADRETRLARWQANKAQLLRRRASAGIPDGRDRGRSART